MEENKLLDLIIIGAGPTGLNIGIDAKKSKLNFIILEKGMLVNSIYNFPTNMTFFSTSKNLEIGGIPFISHSDKPTRKEALEYYRRIYEHFDLPINFNEEVISCNKKKNNFEILTSGARYNAKNIVISTGYYDQANALNIPGEELGKVRHYYDDAHPYIGTNLTVIGGANSACDVALETWQKGANVTMVVRNKQLYQKVKYWILPNIENRIKAGEIKAYFSSEVTEITKDKVKIKTPNGVKEIDNDYVLAMTGYQPNYNFIKSFGIELNEEDRTPVFNPATLESNIKNIYVAGVINAGSHTSKLFIENTREHGEIIVNHILTKN